MDNHQKTAAAATRPKITVRLGDVDFGPTVAAPLGGINPYSPHFDKIGNQFKQLMIEYAGLTRQHRVLDFGCGTGRLAKALSGFFGNGTYSGVDLNQRFIDYCRDAHSGFEFEHCDVQHDEYNHGGTVSQAEFELPYASKSFDVVAAIAVFNHLRTPVVAHCIGEMARVLKPRGVLLATAIILNPPSIAYVDTRTTQPYMFPCRTDDGWFDFEERPLFNVAHMEGPIRRAAIRNSLMIREPIRYGDWCLSKISVAGPDIIIAKKA